MIDSSKLLSRDSTRRSPISSKVVANIVVIRRDSKKIDDILKERLVLSKVRSGMLKQQEERDRRKKKEEEMETDESPRNYRIDQPETKKRKGFGGFIGAVFQGIMGILSGFILKFAPKLIALAAGIIKITKPFIRIVSSVLKFFTVIAGGKIFSELFKRKSDFDKKKIEGGFNFFRGSLDTLSTALIAYTAASVAGDFFDSFGRITGVTEPEQKIGGKKYTGKQADILVNEDGQIKRIRRETYERKITKKQRDLVNAQKTTRRLTPGQKYLRREKRLVFPVGSELVKERTLADGRQIVTLGNSDVILESTIVDGKEVFTTKKTRDIKKVLAKEAKVRPRDISLTAKDFDAEKIILDARANKAAMTAAGEDMLLDEIFSSQKIKSDAIKEKKLLDNLEMKKMTKPKPGEAGRTAILLKKLKPEFVGKPLITPAMRLERGLRGLLVSIGGIPLVKATRTFLGNTVGKIPFLGDLIALLLDIFVFKEPVGRAAFMAIGGILGSFAGAFVGSLLPGPGTIIGGILGGIGGDIIGAALYDLLFGGEGGINPVRTVTKTTTKKTVKDIGLKGFNMGGLVAKRSKSKKNSGIDPRILELYPDLDPTKPGDYIKLKRKSIPIDLDLALRDYAYYEKNQGGRETMIPIPIPVTQTTDQQSQTIIIDGGNNQKSNTFSTLYRRG